MGSRCPQLGVIGFVFLLLCASWLPAERVLLDGIAAKVNARAISVGAVLQRVQSLQRELEERYSGEALRAKMQAAYEEELNALIDQQLILEAYEAQEGRIPDWVVDQRIGVIIQERFEGDRDALRAALRQDGLSYDEWRRDLRDQLIVTSMQQNHVRARVAVSANAVYDVYRRNPEDFKEPAEVQLSMMVLNRSASGAETNGLMDKAVEIHRRVAAGADFAELARTHSQGPRAAEGGQWNWVELGMLRPALRAAAEALGEGDISPIIETEEALYVLRLDGRRGGRAQPFEEVRQEIEAKLRRQEAERLYTRWMATLRDNAYIDVVADNPYAR